MAKRCPLCDLTLKDDASWRRHLLEEHDWDPSGEPTYIGDALVAIGFGFVVFLALMMSSLCATGAYGPRGCDGLIPWFIAGVVSLVAGLLVVVVRPVQRLWRRRWIASGRANAGHHERPMSSLIRERLRRLDAVASVAMGTAFPGIFFALVLAQQDTERSGLWLLVTSACVAIVLISGFIRSRVRKRTLT